MVMGRARDLLPISLAVISVIASGFAARQWQIARETRAEVEILKSDLALEKKDKALQNKIRCSKYSEKEFLSLGYSNDSLDDFRAHYSEKYHTCLINIIIHNFSSDTSTEMQTVFDVYERRDFGEFFWRSNPGKNYETVRPVTCQMRLPDQITKQCTSRDEWDSLTSELFSS